jgi:Domain of unknown function (DUF2017)
MGDDQPRRVTGGGPDESAQPEDSAPTDESAQRPGDLGYLEELMGGFRASGSGATARFAAAQADIIRDLVGQVVELIAADAPDEAVGEAQDSHPGEPADWPDPGDLEALAGLADNPDPPDDPVVARLLPDAYRDDPEASGEFRRYTEPSLRSEKVAAAKTVLATLPARGGRVRLSEPEAQAWLKALNDVRLALGTRLGVTDDFDDQVTGLRPDDPRSAAVGIYQWLAFLQESLVNALS